MNQEKECEHKERNAYDVQKYRQWVENGGLDEEIYLHHAAEEYAKRKGVDYKDLSMEEKRQFLYVRAESFKKKNMLVLLEEFKRNIDMYLELSANRDIVITDGEKCIAILTDPSGTKQTMWDRKNGSGFGKLVVEEVHIED